MKIVHINTLNEGGAYNAVKRLHLTLIKNGIDSKLLLLHQPKEDIPGVYWYLGNRSIAKKIIDSIRYRIHKRFNPYFNYASPISPYRIHQHDLMKWADIIQLHWVANFLDHPSFFQDDEVLSKPIVWRMPDLYPIRGIIHYDNYLNDKNIKLNDKATKLKQHSMARLKQLQYVCTSNWLLENCAISPLGRERKKRVIPNAINTNVFCPKVQKSKSLDISILFVANKIDNPNKGLNDLIIALDLLPAEWLNKINLTVVGQGVKPKCSKKHQIEFIGGVENEEKMIELYQKSDIYISPTYAEAFGQTILEAIATGCAVIVYPNGGVVDMVIDEKTGLHTKQNNPQGLTESIMMLLENLSLRTTLATNARNHAVKNFTPEIQVKKYKELYNELLD